MFIACTEKCAHQKDGLCMKNDCAPQNEFISGNISCPHFEPEKTEAISNKNIKSPITSEDHKRF